MKNFSLFAFLAMVGRVVIFGAAIGDALAIFALAALYGYTLYLTTKTTIPLNDQIRKELDDVKGAINGLKLSRTVR